jgi:hypothetical protein
VHLSFRLSLLNLACKVYSRSLSARLLGSVVAFQIRAFRLGELSLTTTSCPLSASLLSTIDSLKSIVLRELSIITLSTLCHDT